ncbi:MAG: hypothetical protein D6714_17325 [Bacteroidetes bacterium]|nr:MAG: hypothetical protein D6714_17325 [Bacteroidota bacterium]
MKFIRHFAFMGILFFGHFLCGQTLTPVPFEQNDNATPTYPEVIAFYEQLAARHPQLNLTTWGTTDAGFPIHTAVLSTDGDFDPVALRQKGKTIFLINNAIHPGEPCGVDASMLLLRDLLEHPEKQALIKDVVLVVIPVYNIGGALNRGAYSRANQNGPAAYGFRGNAKNLDLNRDFIKCDSKNARTFTRIFHYWQPDVFVDNHTSNGADYQYTMTLIATQKDKLEPPLAEVLTRVFEPRLYAGMAARNFPLTPYVNVRSTPDEGIAGFLDLPRYSSGYAALHHCLAFTSESHMLKPYRDRVRGTYALMVTMLEILRDEGARIRAARQKAIGAAMQKDSFDLNWRLDFTQKDSFLFKGYEARYKPSVISGKDRLWYDHEAPYEKWIPFYNTYRPTARVARPVAYLIPQAYSEVIDRLKWNGVQTRRLAKDTTLDAEFYYIRDFKTRDAYEGHYLHSGVEVEKKTLTWTFHAGDYVIWVEQPASRYIVETLEPQGADSFFAWNFFDGILQQKEYFSSYVFEDLAAEYLRQNPEIAQQLAAAKAADPKLADSARGQLDFIYKHSPHYEKTHRLYPVGKLVSKVKLPLR